MNEGGDRYTWISASVGVPAERVEAGASMVSDDYQLNVLESKK